MKRNIKMHIAYDGTRYQGFQRLNEDVSTIQDRLEKTLSKILGEDVKVIGSSRTDAGVHALDQVINFYTYNDMGVNELLNKMNSQLPEDIVVTFAEAADERFHSRYWCEKKTYLYRIYIGEIPPLFERKYVYNLNKKPDIAKMKEAAGLLMGTHDFQGFCKRIMKKSSVRTIYEINIEKSDNEIKVYITADGFLYNMVRIIVGTLIEAGLSERKSESIRDILDNKIRADAGYLVPATGLFLYKNYFMNKKEGENYDDE